VLVAYVSGHGFGHATRTAEVLRVLREQEPSLPIGVVTAAPEALFRAAVPGSFTFRHRECDVGLVQRDALVIDEAETARHFEDFRAGWDAAVDEEAAFLQRAGARLVLGDIPPLAFAAAAAAGVPGVGLANFSWDWIYRHASPRAPALADAAEHCATAYRKASLLLRLPFSGDLSSFPRIEDVPLVARRPRVPKAESRKRLSLDGRPAVLLSFGGVGLPGFRPQLLAPMREFRFLTSEPGAGLPENVRVVSGEHLHALGLGYEDVVAAADVVVSKPGYGIVTDAIGARTRLVYTDRGEFPEYPILVEEMRRYIPAAYVTNDELREGHLARALRDVLDLPFPTAPDLSGAARVAERLRAMMQWGPEGRGAKR
jgi:hypothetical protein